MSCYFSVFWIKKKLDIIDTSYLNNEIFLSCSKTSKLLKKTMQEILIIPEKKINRRDHSQVPLLFHLYSVQCFLNVCFVFYKKVLNTI